MEDYESAIENIQVNPSFAVRFLEKLAAFRQDAKESKKIQLLCAELSQVFVHEALRVKQKPWELPETKSLALHFPRYFSHDNLLELMTSQALQSLRQSVESKQRELDISKHRLFLLEQKQRRDKSIVINNTTYVLRQEHYAPSQGKKNSE